MVWLANSPLGKRFELAEAAAVGLLHDIGMLHLDPMLLDPKAILLDEPFSALDFQTRLVLQGDVRRIIRDRNKSAILVTHDIGEAVAMADRVLVLSHRPGTVKAIYDIDLGVAEDDPIALRRSSRFNDHFDAIWNDLDIQVSSTV